MKNRIRFDNEYYYKMVTVFFGVLYWMYLLMPTVDRLFDLISAVNLAFIVFLCWKRRTSEFTWILPLMILLSCAATFFVNGMPRVTLIAAAYAVIETVLMIHCDPQKSEQELYAELRGFAAMLVFLAIPILLLSLYTRYADYPGYHANPEFRGYHEVYYYLDVTTTTLHLGRDLSSGALIGILSNANIAADFYVMCLAMLLFLIPGSRYKAVWYAVILLDMWLLFMTLSRGGYLGAAIVLASVFLLNQWPGARGNRKKMLLLALQALGFAAAAVLFVKNGGLGAAVVLALMLILTLWQETRSSRHKEDLLLLLLLCLVILVFLFLLAGDADGFEHMDTAMKSRNDSARILLWRAGWRTVTANAKNFFFGVGQEIKGAIALVADRGLEEGLYNNMHNMYIQTLVAYGLIGLTLFLLYVVKLALPALSAFCRFPAEMRRLTPIIGLCAALLAINLAESDLYMKKTFESTVFWVCCGYVYRLAAIVGKRKAAGAE